MAKYPKSRIVAIQTIYFEIPLCDTAIRVPSTKGRLYVCHSVAVFSERVDRKIDGRGCVPCCPNEPRFTGGQLDLLASCISIQIALIRRRIGRKSWIVRVSSRHETSWTNSRFPFIIVKTRSLSLSLSFSFYVYKVIHKHCRYFKGSIDELTSQYDESQSFFFRQC